MIRALLLATLGLAGCELGVADIPSVPDNPTYTKDVKPYLRDHCLVCHGTPPGRGTTKIFDTFERASAYADIIVERSKNGTMPPTQSYGGKLGPNGIAMLEKWLENGTPE